MAESIYQVNERVIFSTGQQNYFLNSVRKDLGLSWSEFADKIGVHRRTLNDWKLENYSLPLSILEKILQFSKVKMPKSITVKDQYWYIKNSSKLGALAVLKKYGRIGGNPEYRKKKWYEWWEKEGQFNKDLLSHPKEIRKPRKSADLAEFVGIVMGDGGITKSQLIISLDPKKDKDYITFVVDLLTKLFKTKPSIYSKGMNASVVKIVISRVKLVNFCHSIGLRVGNKLKQGLDIPEWVKKRKIFKIACIRGLMDTDGCFFIERHKIKRKTYSYPRIAITSYSEELCNSISKTLRELGFSPRIRNGRNVQLESKEEIKKYFSLIKTNNLKHEKKYESFFGGVLRIG